ncbi:hypothetical protein RJD38_02880 [Vibrio scophthalmi]|uniref:Uncharacterized protein n=1 Tax=Vibrio scophthalmi TaxID=45658 RepID=A0A1B1NSA7_9VIBR|nr:hypothetical protein VSVS12_02807 [Vibrio scophthalmi]ANU35671.1 hypothetical protein VSVS05_00538 [Vibrio scophthalmi]
MRIKYYTLVISLLFSISVSAITVDKMVIIPNESDAKSDIKITNPASYPVFLKVTLSELNSDNETVEFKTDEFQNWPVYVERNEFLVEPEEEIVIAIQHLAKQLNKASDRDRIIAIDIMPESVIDDGQVGQKMSILIGYRVWMIIAKDGALKGEPSVLKTEKGYVLNNASDSVAIFNINLCETEFKKGTECKGSEFVLSGKEKALNLLEFKNGNANISIRDPYDRYLIKETIKL